MSIDQQDNTNSNKFYNKVLIFFQIKWNELQKHFEKQFHTNYFAIVFTMQQN